MVKFFDRLGGLFKAPAAQAPEPELVPIRTRSKPKPKVAEAVEALPLSRPIKQKKPRKARKKTDQAEPRSKKSSHDPYLNASFKTAPDGRIMINVDFNKVFVARLDEKYRDDPMWKTLNADNIKVALCLYDILSEAVAPYLPQPEEESGIGLIEDPNTIPLLAVRGGEENVTRVDIATAKRVGDQS